MDREDALALLQRTTRFQFVGERLVVRDVTLLRAIAATDRVEEEKGMDRMGEGKPVLVELAAA